MIEDYTERWDAGGGGAIVEVPGSVMEQYLMYGMRRNPAAAICTDRRCRHTVSRHKDGVCMHEGCKCDGLVEETE